ncbi:MAG: TonB-dependent receptor [Parvibaculum sp.]|nr:TonB-dependent receptor [Parvibaculum sp.]
MNNSHFGALCISALTLALTTAPAHADETITTQELLITSGAEARPTKEIASSYTIISAKDIETYQYRDVVAALQTVPGLQVVRSGGAGQIASVFTRGANSNQTLVMVNGLAINDPSSPGGAANLANIPMENIERIEVVRGAQSALYGSQAIGGVINIITKSGGDTPVSTAKVEAGTLGTINTSASTSGKVLGTDYFLSASRDATDGNDVTPTYLRGTQTKEKDSNEAYGISGKVGFPIGDIAKSNLSIQYTSANTDIDDSGDDAFFTPVYENYNNQIKTTRLLIGGDVSGSYFNNRWRPKFSAGLVRTISNSYDYAAGADDSVYSYQLGYSGDTKTLAFDNAFDLTENIGLTFGESYSEDSYAANGYRDFTGGFVIAPNTDAETSTSATYLGVNFNINDSFFLTLSGRYDVPEDFDNRFSYTIAPAYEIASTNTRFMASYGTGFKAPSLYQMFGFDPNSFGNFYIGNPNLKPETSKSWDAGFEQGLLDDKLRLGATWFHSDIKDAISIVFIGFDSTAINSDELSSEGLETFISYDVTTRISTRIDYTYTLIDADIYTTTMTRRPRHKIGFTADWRPLDGTVLSTNVQWVDPYRDVPRDGFGYYVYPAPYTVVNVALSQKLTDALTLTARINNLLDQKYEPAHGFEAAGIEALAGLAVTF